MLSQSNGQSWKIAIKNYERINKLNDKINRRKENWIWEANCLK